MFFLSNFAILWLYEIENYSINNATVSSQSATSMQKPVMERGIFIKSG